MNIKMDKSSEYYRICPCCKKEFMAEHINRVYCSQFCHDRTNNRKKSQILHTVKHIAADLEIQDKEIDKTQLEKKKYMHNLLVFESLHLEPKGSLFDISFLKEQGIDFEYGDAIFPLDSSGKYHFATYGSF